MDKQCIIITACHVSVTTDAVMIMTVKRLSCWFNSG